MSPQAHARQFPAERGLALEDGLRAVAPDEAAERRGIGGEFRAPEIRARNSGISCRAVRFRRLRGRSRKAEPARRISFAGRMGARIRQRAARRHEIAPGKRRKRTPPSLCSFRAGVATLSRSACRQSSAAMCCTGAHVEHVAPHGALVRKRPTRFISERNGRTETHSARARRDGHACVHRRASAWVAFPRALAHTLSGIAYAGVAVVAAGYYAKQVGACARRIRFSGAAQRKTSHAGHGVEFVAFSRARARRARCTITSFVGGATEPDILDKAGRGNRGHRAGRKTPRFWASPGRRWHRRYGSIRRRCRNTIWGTGTSWRPFAMARKKIRGCFSRAIIWKGRRSANAWSTDSRRRRRWRNSSSTGRKARERSLVASLCRDDNERQNPSMIYFAGLLLWRVARRNSRRSPASRKRRRSSSVSRISGGAGCGWRFKSSAT